MWSNCWRNIPRTLLALCFQKPESFQRKRHLGYHISGRNLISQQTIVYYTQSTLWNGVWYNICFRERSLLRNPNYFYIATTTTTTSKEDKTPPTIIENSIKREKTIYILICKNHPTPPQIEKKESRNHHHHDVLDRQENLSYDLPEKEKGPLRTPQRQNAFAAHTTNGSPMIFRFPAKKKKNSSNPPTTTIMAGRLERKLKW